MWLIIGYGNRLRGDDGAGPAFAERLRAVLPSDFARIISQHQLTPELVLECVKPEIDRVLFIDVKRQQTTACEISPLSPIRPSNASCGHQFSPELLLTSADKLYGQRRTGWLLTLPGFDFGFDEQLSRLTQAAIETAILSCRSFLHTALG